MNLSTFLPQDTRAIEFISAFALLLTSMFIMFGAPISPWMLELHSREFWVMVLASFGIVQLIGVVRDSFSAEVIRAIVTWLVGMFWVWLSLEYLIDTVRATEVAALILGVSNFYAFVLNLSLLMRSKWN